MHHVFTLARKLARSAAEALRMAVGAATVVTSVVASAAYSEASAASTRHVSVHARAGIVVEASSTASHASSRFHATIEMTVEQKKIKMHFRGRFSKITDLPWHFFTTRQRLHGRLVITSGGKMASRIIFISATVPVASISSVLDWSGRGHNGRLSLDGGHRGHCTFGIVVRRLQDVGRS